MTALMKSALEIQPKLDLLIIAESDNRRTEWEQEQEFTYVRKRWVVHRCILKDGNAMKVVFRADLKIAVRNVMWYDRNVLISLHSDRGDIDILGCHWKHKDDWWTSFEEALSVCISSSRQFILIGDLNVESRTLH